MSKTASSKRIFHIFFSIFELGSITKHLMTGSAGNSEFCSPSTLLEGLVKTKFTFSLGAVKLNSFMKFFTV